MSARGDFWSRRKAGVAAEAEAMEARAEPIEAPDERSDAEILAELNLAEPETLETPDAVKEFLRAELPERLKTRALRRLWRLNPVLANLDGLVDYGEDYTDAAMVVENMQTVYQVGKGMLTALVEPEADDTEVDETPAPEEEDAPAPQIVLAETPPEPDPAPAMPQRRMRFAFEETG